MGEADLCGETSGDRQRGNRGTIYDGDAMLIRDSVALDYALILLDVSLPNKYGYLDLSNRVADVGEQLYIPRCKT